MKDLLVFRTMIAPFLIQIIFWTGAAASVVSGIWLVNRGVWSGWFAMTMGPLMIRVLCELAIIQFRIHQELKSLADGKN